MTCPATLGSLRCQRVDDHDPHKGCVYHASTNNLGDHQKDTDEGIDQ